MPNPLWALGLVAAFACSSARLTAAEAGPAPATITLDRLIELAREHAPTRDHILAQRAQAAAALREAGAWRNPELELNGGRARFREEGTSTGIGSVTLAQALPSPWRRSAELAVAESGLPRAEAAAALAWLELELSVREAATEHATADEAVILAGVAATTARDLRAAVEARARAGEAGQAELARARVEEAQAVLLVERRQREVEATRAALATWCGQDVPADPLISDALPLIFPALHREALIRRALDHGPRLRLAATAQGQRQAELVARRRAWQPEVKVTGAFNREADADSWEVGVGVELPLWNRHQGSIERAAAELALAETELRASRGDIEREVLAAWSDYERERSLLASLISTLRPATAEAQRLTLLAFQAGSASFADLLESRRAVLRVDDEALAAKRAAMTAWLRLAAVGGDFSLGKEMKP